MPPESPALPSHYLDITMALALAAAFAGVGALLAGRLAERMSTAVGREPTADEPVLLRTLRVVRIVTFLVVFAVVAFPALDIAGVSVQMGLDSEALARWAAATGVRIAALLLMAFVLVRVMSAVIVRAERDMTLGSGLDALERRKRAQTIASMVRHILSILIWSATVLMVLRELDVDITPLLTGAGILGLGVGIGAQALVRDVITGFFLIIEDQIRVGDSGLINGIGGQVEQINLRTIVLRDGNGTVHVIPNGEIRTLANQTKDYSFYTIDLGVDHSADTDHIISLVREAAGELMVDPAYEPFILGPLEVMGIEEFKESSITLRFRIKTTPPKQWEVGRELRRRIKQILDREGVRLPAPRLDITITRDETRHA